MVEKVHSPTLEELKLIRDKLGLANLPEYVSKLELPVLAARDYKNTPNHLITEAFLLPNGEVVDLSEFVTGNRVTIVAPAGLENGRVYIAKSDGDGDFDLVKVNEGPLDDVYAEAFVVKDKNGNMNTLTIVVWKVYREGSGYYEELAGEKDFRIGNNVADTYEVGGYKVYVKTTGRDKIEKCYVAEGAAVPPAVNPVSVTPSAVLQSLSGNNNNLTITVVERFTDGTTKETKQTFSVANNAEGTYNVGVHRVYVNIKGNSIREVTLK